MDAFFTKRCKKHCESRAHWWLQAALTARQQGMAARASQCYARAQYWVDRFAILARGQHRAPASVLVAPRRWRSNNA